MREIVVNALIHRDYTIAGGAVSLAIFDDRVEIWSAGKFPNGITPESLKAAHLSVQRNPIIAEVFYRLHSDLWHSIARSRRAPPPERPPTLHPPAMPAGAQQLSRTGGWDSIKGHLAPAYGSWWADAVVLASIGRQLDKFEN